MKAVQNRIKSARLPIKTKWNHFLITMLGKLGADYKLSQAINQKCTL